MRWNCPHCEELVTAGIDFENTKKAYVRCAKCNGMALIHRSAVLADYVKARRMEEEAQLEAELRLTQTAAANSRLQAMETQLRGLNERLSSERAMSANRLEAPKSAPSNAGADFEVPRHVTPPPFRPAYEDLEEGSTQSALPASPPAFNFSRPPAFLLKSNAVETIERSFATDEDGMPISPILATAASIEAVTLAAELPPELPRNAHQSTIALWIAAALALASGLYLYEQGRQAFAPAATEAPLAELVTRGTN